MYIRGGNAAPDVKRFESADRFGETYSGADMSVYMAFPGHRPLWIGTVSTVSYTVYREKKQVRTLGAINAKGIVKGPRTISGRLIFTVMAEHIVESIRREIPYLHVFKNILMDELPPFDLLVTFGNEYGSGAGLVVQGITTVDEQKTMTVEDLFTENIFTYLARGLEPMRDMYANRIKQPYEPLDWYTSDFRHPQSEVMAKFKVNDLMLTKESLLLADPTPFIGGPEEWDSEAAPEMQYEKLVTIKGEGGSNGNTSWGGQGSKVFVQVYDGSKAAQQPIEGATVVCAGQSLTTDKKGEVSFYTQTAELEVFATKDGYKQGSGNPAKITTDKTDVSKYVRLPLIPRGGVANPGGGKCDGKDKTTIGEVRPIGVWYKDGATSHWVMPTNSKGEKYLYPKPSVQVVNRCGEPLPKAYVTWMYEIANFSKVKKNDCWGDTWLPFSCVGQIKQEKGFLHKSIAVDKDGTCTMPEFNFGKFPAGAAVKVIAEVKDFNATDYKMHTTYYFELSGE